MDRELRERVEAICRDGYERGDTLAAIKRRVAVLLEDVGPVYEARVLGFVEGHWFACVELELARK